MRTERRVVITGIGTINPIGNNVEEYFANLEKGVSGADTVSLFDPTNFKSRIACEVKDYDWSKYFDRKEVRKYDGSLGWTYTDHVPGHALITWLIMH